MLRQPKLRAKDRIRNDKNRRGAISILSAFMIAAAMGIMAFAIDVGHICHERTKCQNAADAASHAAACSLLADRENLEAAEQEAINYATINMPDSGNVLLPADVTFGIWNQETRTFTSTLVDPDSVQVVVRRSESNGNPLSLFFGSVLNTSHAEVVASTVTRIPSPGGASLRFLIDDEMIDSDEQDIEDLANQIGVDKEDLISDLDDDGWIDIPVGSVLELPTGQVGDEALFDLTTYPNAFPFTATSPYTEVEFLAEGTAFQDILGTVELHDVEWNGGNAPHSELVGKKLLDPTPGVDPVDNHQTILNLPDPTAIYVSPVFKSDVSMAETDPSKYGSPAANLQGERRGLVAFKITGSRSNPNGGSYLPLLTIEIVEHNSIDIENLGAGGGGNVLLRPTIVK